MQTVEMPEDKAAGAPEVPDTSAPCPTPAEGHPTPDADRLRSAPSSRGRVVADIPEADTNSSNGQPEEVQSGKRRTRKLAARSTPTPTAEQIPLPDSMTSLPTPFEPSDRAYFLTNRGNLLHILSSGLIAPRAAFTKYYPDPGELCPGAVLLLSVPPSQDLVATTVAERPGQFPVILELDITGLRGTVRSLDTELQLRQIEAPPSPGTLAFLIPGAIPAACITAIHFPSPSGQREFGRTPYSTVRELGLPTFVSPHVFEGPDVDVTGLTDTVTRACEACPDPQPSLWRRADSLAGALLVFAKLIESDPRQKPENLVRWLNELPADSQPRTETTTPATITEQLLALLPPLLIAREFQGSPVRGYLPTSLVAASVSANPDDETAAEMLLFLAIVDHIANLTPAEHTAGETLAEVGRIADAILATLDPDRGQALSDRCVPWLTEIRTVIEQETDINAFSCFDFPVPAGILRFLLQPDPQSALDLEADVLARFPAAVSVSVLLSGILHGRARIPVDCRPSREAEEFIDTSVAGRLNRYLAAPDWTGGVGQPSVELQTEDQDGTETLTAGGVILLRRHRPGPEPRPSSPPGQKEALEAKEKPSDAEAAQQQPPGKELSVSLPAAETPVPSEHITKANMWTAIRRRLLASELVDAREREAVVALCREAGWEDCLTTVLPLEGRTFILTNHEGRLQLRVRGSWLHTGSVEVRLPEFRRHLDSKEWDLVTSDVLSTIATALGEERIESDSTGEGGQHEQ